jgi:uncharacterized protein YdiU (UPF0061 family)
VTATVWNAKFWPLRSLKPQPASNAETMQILGERDDAIDWADRLAQAIAEHLTVDSGEHSNANLPWQAALIAQWMSVGFVHGVMNTDNMAISGETIDYGPCAFMDHYHPSTVFSSIDHQGRYAYANQPNIAQWNLARFAETLLPLLAAEQEPAIEIAEAAIRAFPGRYRAHWLARMRSKLGLITEEDGDAALVEDLLGEMQLGQLDFTNTFRTLASEEAIPQGLENWLARWQARLQRQDGGPAAARQLMHAVNPAVIPRNQMVEAALDAATERNDLRPVHELLAVLTKPFDTPDHARYTTPAPAGQRYQTFCGT